MMLSRMSRSAACWDVSECINNFPLCGRADRRFEKSAIDDIGWKGKQVFDQQLDASVIVDRADGVCVRLNQDVDVTIRPVVTTGA